MNSLITNLIMICIIGVSVLIYFMNNPVGHSKDYRMRCFLNWFPLGLTYAFLYMGRYNLTVSKSALEGLMSNEQFGTIFGVGALVYGFAFLINGPLTDKIGGRKAILIASLGASVMNFLMGIVTYMVLNGRIDSHNLTLIFSILYALNMYFQSYGAVAVVKVNSFWFHVKERGIVGGIFGTLISLGLYFAFDWGDTIVRATELVPKAPLGIIEHIIRPCMISESAKIAPTWFVFFIPSGILFLFFIMDLFIVKDRPGEAGFEDFDTGDASSGEMDKEFTTMELFKKLLTNPTVLTIAFIEFCSGILRNGVMHWYHIFMNQMENTIADPQKYSFPLYNIFTGQPENCPDLHIYEGAKFFISNWGLLLCFAGIFGGFASGFISDKLFQSRRGPSAVFMYSIMIVAIIIMNFVVITNQFALGMILVLISLCVIGVHGILSGTATADFGGRKAAATAVGLVDGFVYLGTALQSTALGYLTTKNWHYWPLFLIPFSITGLILALRIWAAMPDSKKGHH